MIFSADLSARFSVGSSKNEIQSSLIGPMSNKSRSTKSDREREGEEKTKQCLSLSVLTVTPSER